MFQLPVTRFREERFGTSRINHSELTAHKSQETDVQIEEAAKLEGRHGRY
jgi:hypothetical protein